MDIILKIKELNSNIDKIEQLSNDLMEGLESKTKKIENLKKQIEINIKKIDEVIEEYHANS